MKTAQICLNCLNCKVNLKKGSARCTKDRFACSVLVFSDPTSRRNRVAQHRTAFTSFVAADGKRWLFDTDLAYWGLLCRDYDHNPIVGGEDE
jgi:hypothetical protein